MTWTLALKLIVVVIFLIMFIRRPSVVWGIGLLTVTTAVLLDTLLGTFDRQALEAELGFFYFAIAGSLFAGGALWLWGLLGPLLRRSNEEQAQSIQEKATQTASPPAAVEPAFVLEENSGFDVALIRQEIHDRFGREDVLDLMFDLEIPENEVISVDQNLSDLVDNILVYCQRHGTMGALALAVERILTPPPLEHLPRSEKITAASPPTILRQYLLAHYSLTDLQDVTTSLGIDWEQLDAGAKREKVRSLLQYLYRRNRIADIVEVIHEDAGSAVA